MSNQKMKQKPSLCTCQQTIEKQFQCPEQFGYYSDTDDCSKYFVCVFGDALHESCTGGLHFSVELQTCDWPRNVGCPYAKPASDTSQASSSGSEDGFSSNRRAVQPSTSARSSSRSTNTADVRSVAGGRAGSRYRVSDDDEERQHGGANSRSNQLSPPSTRKPQTTVPVTTPIPTTHLNFQEEETDSQQQTTTALSVYYESATNLSLEPLSSTPPPKETQLVADTEESSSAESPASNRFPGYDQQQPQVDEAVPPVVDAEGRVHIPDGVYSNGPRNSDEDISVFVKHIYTNPNPAVRKERVEDRYTQLQEQSRATSAQEIPEEKDTEPILEFANNNGQSNDPDQVSRFYRSDGQTEPGRDRVSAVLQLYRSNPRDLTPNNAYRTQQSQPASQRPVRVQETVRNDYSRTYDNTAYHQQDQERLTPYTETQSERNYINRNQSPRYLPVDEVLPVQVQHTNNGHSRDPDIKTSRQDSRYSRTRGNRQGRVLPVERTKAEPEVHSPTPVRDEVKKEPNARSQHYGYESQRDFSRYPQGTEAPQIETLNERKTYSDYASLPYGYSDQYDSPNKQEVFVARQRTSATRSSRPRTTQPPTTTTSTTPAPPPPRTRRPPPASRGDNRKAASNEPRAPEKLPSRPPPVYVTPEPFTNALRCSPRNCKLPDCRCGGSDIPGGLASSEVPQVVLITFDDAINDLNFDLYEDLFESRRNPNNCPIRGSFYVSHEWTDYGKVQTLYSRGHEMASHSVTHSFGEKFSKSQWIKEIHGQREILNLYGGVKLEDVRGMRAPFLQIGGNKMFEMLYETNFTYDSSMPVFENNPAFWPYTLDYAINNECMIAPCPNKAFPGVWEIGMVMWVDLRGGRCSMGDACSNPNDEEGVYKMLIKNFNRHYKGNRAPFGLYYHSAWFSTQHHKKGFMRFLDEINSKKDVWFLTNWQLIQWLRNPTPQSKINNFEPWQCKEDPSKPPECHNPTVCNVWSSYGVRYMKTCQPCPTKYPWVGKAT